jgi:hypothetical protein
VKFHSTSAEPPCGDELTLLVIALIEILAQFIWIEPQN